MTERKGKKLRELPAGDRRRGADARNAWRKMTDWQRLAFLRWATFGESAPTVASDVAECLLEGVTDAD